MEIYVSVHHFDRSNGILSTVIMQKDIEFVRPAAKNHVCQFQLSTHNALSTIIPFSFFSSIFSWGFNFEKICKRLRFFNNVAKLISLQNNNHRRFVETIKFFIVLCIILI